MDLLSCWHYVPIHKCYRSTDNTLEASWNNDRSRRCRSAMSPAYHRLSHDSSLSVDGIMNEENLLELDESVHQLLDCDGRLMRIYRFLCSEKSYLDEIYGIFEIYVEPLQKCLLLTDDEMCTLFSNLELLIHSGFNLCKQLRSAIDNWDSKSTQIGHLFTDEFLGLLDSYSNEYIEIQRLLRNKRSTSSEFAKFCQQREAAGNHSLDYLLCLPMKRMAFYAEELKEMTSELDSDHPDMTDLLRAANEANRMVKQQRSTDNENCLTMIQERFPHDDLHLTDKETQGYGIGRWKSAARAVQNIGGKRQSTAQLLSSSDANLVISERSYVMECPVKLTLGMQTQQRHLFLFTDLLLIAKGRINFRLKHRIRICDLWVAPCTEKLSNSSVIIGWPTTNIIATFEKSEQKELFQKKLRELIMAEKAKEIPQSIQIKILRKDCDFTAIKSLVVANTETSSHVVERCLDEFHITDASAVDFHLCVLSTEDDTTYSLSGHEYPFTVWMSHVPDSSLHSVDNISAADTKIQFLLRNSKKMPQKVVLSEVNKPRKGKALKRLFAKPPSSKQGHVAAKFFCRNLGDLSEQDATIPHPVMQMLKKLYVDGPCCDGIFRKSANHAKFQAVKQALDNGEKINFDEIPVLMTAVLLKDFLRNLPNCLLNCQLYSKWIEAILLPDHAERIASIKRLVQQLPPRNQLLLRHLICVLYNLASHSDTCKMNSSNLAICVGQSVLWSGAGVAQKEDAENANHLVQQMIDFAKDIFGPDCLMLFDSMALIPASLCRNFSADTDSIDPSEDSVCNSFDLEFSRSCSEADSSPAVPDRAGFLMQSSRSCDSGLQLGNEVHDNLGTASSLMPSLSPQLKQTMSSESREEKEKTQNPTKNLWRSKKRPAPGIPVMQQSSSTDTLPSIRSIDSLLVHSTGSALDELAESPVVQSSSNDSATLSGLIQSTEASLSQSTESPLNQPKELCSTGTVEPSASQSAIFAAFQSSENVQAFKSGQNDKKFRTTLSDDSVLESFDETSEDSSDAEFVKDLTASEQQFSTKDPSKNVCKGVQQQNSNPYVVISSDIQQNTRGNRELDLDQLRRRPPPLSQLHGTTFAEECLETPDELETEKMYWSRNYSPSKAAAAFRMHTSTDSGNFNSDEPCQSADSVATSPELLYPSVCTGSSSQQSRESADDVIDNSSNRQQTLPTRRPLLRTNAVVESDADKLKHGMTASGSDLFPSQIKNLLQQNANVNDKQLPSKSVTAKADKVEHSHTSPSEQRAEQPSTSSWKHTEKWNQGLPTYEEALQQKARQQLHLGNPIQRNGCYNQLKHSQDEKGNGRPEKAEVLLPHCKSLNDISTLITENKNDLTPLQNRSPSQSSILNYDSNTTNQRSAGMKETSRSVCSRTAAPKDASLQKARKQLYLGNGKKSEVPQMPYKACDTRSECHTSSLPHEKYQAVAVDLYQSQRSSSSSALDNEDCNMQEPSSRPRATHKRVRNRHIRKRFSDPRMNMEKCCKGSELGRSKSDSCELCWNIARKQFQTNLRSTEREHSKENIVHSDQFATKKTSMREVTDRSAKSFSAQIKVSEPSLSLRDVNRNREASSRTANRKSLTVKNKNWHRELSQQYVEPGSFSSVISPTGRTGMTHPSNRFGREVKEDVATSTSHSHVLPCININLNVSVTIGSGQNGKDSTDSGLTTSGTCQTESRNDCGSTATKWPDKKDCSTISSYSFKSQLPRRTGPTRSSDSISKKVPVISVPEQRDTFPTLSLTAGSSKISDACFKEADNSSSLYIVNRGNIRPSCETIHDIVDDAVLLNPANISWSVAKLKQFYSDQKTSSGTKSQPVTSAPPSLSHSKSEDLSYRRPSALPRLCQTRNPHEKTRKSQID